MAIDIKHVKDDVVVISRDRKYKGGQKTVAQLKLKKNGSYKLELDKVELDLTQALSTIDLKAKVVSIADAANVIAGTNVETGLVEVAQRSLGGFANITAIKAITATQRSDGAIAVNLTNSDVWVFAAASVAAGDDVSVLAPAAGTGRWLLAGSNSGAPGFGAAGVSTVSKGLVLDANKSTDLLQAKTSLSVGGTGVPGGAAVDTMATKAVAAFADTVAKSVFTVTVPNAAHVAAIDLEFTGILGAGGAVGAGEAARMSHYKLLVVRTAGLATVATLASAEAADAVAGAVAGAASVTSVVATVTGLTGANSATQTFDVQVAITKSGGASDNHTCLARSRVDNKNATGVTIA